MKLSFLTFAVALLFSVANCAFAQSQPQSQIPQAPVFRVLHRFPDRSPNIVPGPIVVGKNGDLTGVSQENQVDHCYFRISKDGKLKILR